MSYFLGTLQTLENLTFDLAIRLLLEQGISRGQRNPFRQHRLILLPKCRIGDNVNQDAMILDAQSGFTFLTNASRPNFCGLFVKLPDFTLTALSAIRFAAFAESLAGHLSVKRRLLGYFRMRLVGHARTRQR
jgi:hypothetical protein